MLHNVTPGTPSTMNYAILRLEKRTLPQARAMAEHALRERPTHNADPAKKEMNVALGKTTVAEVMKELKDRTEPLVKRKDAVRVIELFVGASPEIMKEMSRKQQDVYFGDALRWVCTKFGGKENIVSAVIHFDETTPHMQILLTPILDGKLNAKALVGGPAGLVALQDDFAERVGSLHGMRRGERGSRAHHSSVRAFYGAIEAAGSKEALPQRVPVAPLPPVPGRFASALDRQAYAAAEKARMAALERNKVVQAQIVQLATLGLATHGLRRRKLPKQLSEAEAVMGQLPFAKAIIREARDELENGKRTPEAVKVLVAKANASVQAEKSATRPSARPRA